MKNKLFLLALFSLFLTFCASQISAQQFEMPETLMQKGLEEMRKGNIDEAIKIYSEAIKQDSSSSNLFNLRGVAYLRKRNFDAAILDFSTAIALKPNSAGLFLNRSGAYKGKKDFEKAFADVERAFEIEPENADAWSIKGGIYRDQKDFPKAIESYTKAISITRKYYFFVSRCMVYYENKEFEKAALDCSEAISINPKDFMSYYYRARARKELGQMALAIADYQKTLEVNPNFTFAKRELDVLEKANK